MSAVTASVFGHAASGNLALAIPVAMLAGLVSFLSPCVLPLAPAYLSYITGLSTADLAAEQRPVSDGPGAAVAIEAVPRNRHRTSRVLIGSILFIAGFSVVFISFGALFGEAGAQLAGHATLVNRVAGVVTVVMGAAFMGLVPGFQREWRFHRLPVLGVAAAPLIGLAFGVGWVPCIGPTLTVVLTLAADPHGATAARGAVLTTAYCAGLGLPFVVAGLVFRRALGAFAMVKRHYAVVVRGGGLLLVAVGILLITGEWTTLSERLRDVLPQYSSPV